jgi:hypothetical protein
MFISKQQHARQRNGDFMGSIKSLHCLQTASAMLILGGRAPGQLGFSNGSVDISAFVRLDLCAIE